MTKRAPAHVIDSLAAIPLFSACNRRELEQVARLGTIVEVGDQATLTVQGRPGHEFVLVMTGHARCFIDGAEVARFGPGDHFGELALLDGGPRTATVVAEGDGQFLVLGRREFDSLLDLAVPVTKKLLVQLARRYRAVVSAGREAAGREIDLSSRRSTSASATEPRSDARAPEVRV